MLAWSATQGDPYKTRMMWAASCLAFFGLLCFCEFTLQTAAAAPVIWASDTAVALHTAPSIVCIHLRKAKTDPFSRGISFYLGRTGTDICPVAMLLNYLLIRPAETAPCSCTRMAPHCLSNNSSPKCVKPWGRLVSILHNTLVTVSGSGWRQLQRPQGYRII